MIDGNQIWKDELEKQKKRPLYYVEVPETGHIITSFLPSEVEVGGATGASWGVMLWGEGLWGN